MAVGVTLFLATPVEGELFDLGSHMPISGSVRVTGLVAGDIFPGLVGIELTDGAGRLLGSANLQHGAIGAPPGQRIDFNVDAPPGPGGKRADFYWTSFAIPAGATGEITIRVTFLPIAGAPAPVLVRKVKLPVAGGGPPGPLPLQGTVKITLLQPRRVPIPRFNPGDSVDVVGDAPVGNDYIYVNGTDTQSHAVVDAALGGIDGAGRFRVSLKTPKRSTNLRLNALAVFREGAQVFGAKDVGVLVQVVAPPAAAAAFGIAAPKGRAAPRAAAPKKAAPKKAAPKRAAAAAPAGRTKVNVNTASIDELTKLKGIGPALAAEIAASRKSGKFKKPEDLLEVNGIGPAKLAAIRDDIRF